MMENAGDMVESVGLYKWGCGLHGGVFGYMVESVVLHGGCQITQEGVIGTW